MHGIMRLPMHTPRAFASWGLRGVTGPHAAAGQCPIGGKKARRLFCSQECASSFDNADNFYRLAQANRKMPESKKPQKGLGEEAGLDNQQRIGKWLLAGIS